MKAASWITKILTCILAVAGIVLFFMPFVTIVTMDGTATLTGAQLSFGGGYDIGGETVTLYKSMYFTFAFILSALGVVMAALSFKFKGTKYAAPAFELVAAIALLVYVLSNEVKFVDYRPFTLTSTGVSYTIFPVIALIVLFVGAAAGVASLLTADYVEVAESKGDKKPILVRIGRYLKDLKSEIKKVVWPTKKTLIRNVTVVILMCIIIGGFIWLIDFGLASLLNVIYS